MTYLATVWTGFVCILLREGGMETQLLSLNELYRPCVGGGNVGAVFIS
jgi:hypothetical protein